MATNIETPFDAIVVGSGITGGWAAKELTEAGLKVLMIERGRRIEHQIDYETETKAPWDLPFRGQGDAALYARDYPVQMLNRHFTEFTQGHFVNDAEQPYQTAPGQAFDWFRSYQLGGRSLTWGRQCYRWSDYDFGANKRDGFGTDWPIRYADLAPWYDKVEAFVGVSGAAEGLAQLPDGRFLPPMELNCVEAALRERIRAAYPDRLLTIGRTANLTEARPEQGRAHCQYRNICARGCSYGAYFSTQSATLPAAMKTGRLTVVTDAQVHKLDYDPATRRVTGVHWIDTGTGEHRRAASRIVFLNAGAFNSVHLLLNSASEAMPHGLGNSSGVLGTHIMDHANTMSAMAVVPGFEGRTSFGNRPTGIVIPRFRNLDRLDGDGFTRGYSFQGGALQGTWTRGKRMAGIGAAYKDELRKVGPWTMVLVAFADSMPRASNRLTLSRRTDPRGVRQLEIAFAHGKEELAALADARREAAAMLTTAGAHVVMGFDRPGNGGTAIHEMGGARMGLDPATSVLNRWSQAHDVGNLFVTDGAQMSSSACQNPSLTYMALTARACAAAVAMLREGRLLTRVSSPMPAAHPGKGLTERQKSLAYLTLMVALVLEIVDVTIVNTALPVIEQDFGALAAQAQWVGAGYSLAFALLLMLGGRLGDALGYRTLFIGGIAGFTAASLLCGLSRGPDELIAARVLQGGAGAMMAPQVMALIQILFEPLERVAKLAWVGVIGGLSAIVGPILGGLLIHADLFGLGWRSVFLINVPVGLAALVAAWRLLPVCRSPLARGVDVIGTLLFAGSMAALLVPLVRGHDLAWQPWHVALLIAAPVLLLAAWRRTLRRSAAGTACLFAPALFTQRQFALGLAIALTFGAATGGFLFVFAFGAQALMGYSPLQTGLLHIPFSVGVMFGIAFLGRKLVTRHGKRVLVAGVVLMALFAGTTLGWTGSAIDFVWALPCLALAGTGMGLTTGPLTPVILARVDPHHAGAASGLIKTVQELGSALGIAVVGTAFFAGAPGVRWAPGPAILAVTALLAAALMLAIRLPATLFPEHDPRGNG